MRDKSKEVFKELLNYIIAIKEIPQRCAYNTAPVQERDTRECRNYSRITLTNILGIVLQ